MEKKALLIAGPKRGISIRIASAIAPAEAPVLSARSM